MVWKGHGQFCPFPVHPKVRAHSVGGKLLKMVFQQGAGLKCSIKNNREDFQASKKGSGDVLKPISAVEALYSKDTWIHLPGSAKLLLVVVCRRKEYRYHG